MKSETKYLVFGALAALAVILIVKKKLGVIADAPGEFFTGIGSAIGGAAYDIADGVTSGVVYGVGDAVGVPRTNLTECERAKQEGRTWDASFACPAGDFLSYLWS